MNFEKDDAVLLDSLSDVKKELKKKMKKKSACHPPRFSEKDKKWIELIKEQTRQLNQNNVKRTQAYFQFYLQYPEIHWALLGHMISRNVGWNMTDLKGDLLTKLLPERDQKAFFSFLERGSWLIFQDVYPQFLVYALSVRREPRNVPPFTFLLYFHLHGDDVALFLAQRGLLHVGHCDGDK